MNGTIDARTVLGIIRDREEHLKHLKDEKMIKEMEVAELEKAIKFLEGKKDEVDLDRWAFVDSHVGDKPEASARMCAYPGCNFLASAGHDRCDLHFYKHIPKEKTEPTLEELK